MQLKIKNIYKSTGKIIEKIVEKGWGDLMDYSRVTFLIEGLKGLSINSPSEFTSSSLIFISPFGSPWR